MTVFILSLAFVGCDGDDDGTGDGNGGGDVNLEITNADKIGALLSAASWGGGSLAHVSVNKNIAHFNIPVDGSTDNGFKIDFPEAAKDTDYLAVEITFKVVEMTTLRADENVKIRFQAHEGSSDVTPYDKYELIFGTSATALGVELTQKFDNLNILSQKAVWFMHNNGGNGDKKGSDLPVNYKLQITKIKFIYTQSA